eukprot:Filipodium_phascolosomae@DN2582_c0_g1_i1.p1
MLFITLLAIALVGAGCTSPLIGTVLQRQPYFGRKYPLKLIFRNVQDPVLRPSTLRITSVTKAIEESCPAPLEFQTPPLPKGKVFAPSTPCKMGYDDVSHHEHVIEVSNSNLTATSPHYGIPRFNRPNAIGPKVDVTLTFDAALGRAGWLHVSFVSAVDLPEDTAMLFYRNPQESYPLAPCRYNLPNAWVHSCDPRLEQVHLKAVKAGDLVEFDIRMYRGQSTESLQFTPFFKPVIMQNGAPRLTTQVQYADVTDVEFTADVRLLREEPAASPLEVVAIECETKKAEESDRCVITIQPTDKEVPYFSFLSIRAEGHFDECVTVGSGAGQASGGKPADPDTTPALSGVCKNHRYELAKTWGTGYSQTIVLENIVWRAPVDGGLSEQVYFDISASKCEHSNEKTHSVWRVPGPVIIGDGPTTPAPATTPPPPPGPLPATGFTSVVDAEAHQVCEMNEECTVEIRMRPLEYIDQAVKLRLIPDGIVVDWTKADQLLGDDSDFKSWNRPAKLWTLKKSNLANHMLTLKMLLTPQGAGELGFTLLFINEAGNLVQEPTRVTTMVAPPA